MNDNLTNLKAAAMGLTAFGIYALGDAAGKFLTDEYSAFEISFWQALFSLLSLLIAAPWMGGLQKTLRTTKLPWHLVRAMLSTLITVLVYYSLYSVTLVNFYTLIFMAPFLTALISTFFLKEHVPWYRWVVILGGFAGIVIALRPGTNHIGLPELAVMGSAIAFALRNLIVPKMGEQETLLSYGLFPYIAIVFFTGLALLIEPRIPDNFALLLFLVTGIGSAAGLALMSTAFRIAPSSIVAPTHYSQLLWGLVLGMVIFGDIPDLWSGIGALVVLICGLALIFMEKRKAAQALPPDEHIMPP